MSETVFLRSEALNIVQSDSAPMEHKLGYGGPGVFALKQVIRESFREQLLEEMQHIPWWDAGDVYTNNRGIEIVQNHDVFALKLSRGDTAPIEAVPRMRQLADESEMLIQSLGQYYGSLSGWEADEMSYHRYYDKEVGLSFHRDNMRFPGLILVASIDGECDFQVIDREPADFDDDGKVTSWNWRSTYTIPTEPGDVVLTRAPGLLPSMSPDDRPEHAVVNVRVLPRISFMLRANNKPDDSSYGFTYYNWP